LIWLHWVLIEACRKNLDGAVEDSCDKAEEG